VTPVRIAVAGAGLIGQRHLEEIAASPAARVASIVDPGPAGPELAEVVLSRYVVAAMELVDLESDVALETEDAPIRHLSVVSA